MSGRTNANRKLIALAGAVALSSVCAQAQAFTYLWTRGSGNPGSSNWSNAANWTAQDGGPLPIPQAATDTDLLYSGTPLNPGNNATNQDYTIRSITIAADYNAASLNFNINSNTPAILTLGSGGITHNNENIIVRFQSQATGVTPEQQRIVIAAPQTWFNKVSATGAGTLTVSRQLQGDAGNTITKSGPGLLILTQDNSSFLGGFSINEGTIRLQNSSSAFGNGPLSALAAGTVGITASTDLPQTIAGPLNFGGGGQINFGGSFPFTWNGQVNMLSDKSISNSATVSITANGAFTGPGKYIKVGGGTLILNAPANTHGGFDVRSGFLPIDSDAKLGAAGAPLGIGAISAGTFGVAIITAPINAPTRPLAFTGSGDIGVLDIGSNNVTFGSTSGTNGFRKVGTGVLTLANLRADGQVAVDAGNVVIASNGTDAGASRVGTLSLAAGSSLDLNDNDLVLVNDTYANVTSQIAAARNGGSWNGTGITSSSAGAASPANKTLGTLTGAEYASVNSGTFDGFAVVDTDVLVKYTYYGDTDLNGLVNFDDYSRIDSGFNNGRTGWLNGDFDYNGSVNFDDYSLIDNAFNTQTGVLSGPALQAVPEPAGVALIAGLAALAAGSRGRRARRNPETCKSVR